MSVRLEAVSRVFPTSVEVVALRDVTLSISAGEYVGVSGPSGSGKSTLLNMVGLLDRPTDGEVWIGGVRTAELTELERGRLRAEHIGFVFQAFHLLPHRSICENVEMGMLYRSIAKRERRSRALDALEVVGLGDRAADGPRQLSGGEQQRVAIARAVAQRPSVVLCDEPTGNLDRRTSDAVLELLSNLHKSGHTVVVVSHDPAVIARADRVVEVSDGRASERPG